MVRHEERERCVNDLRQCAKECSVPLIGATSGRDRVGKFAADIKSSDGPARRARTSCQFVKDVFRFLMVDIEFAPLM